MNNFCEKFHKIFTLALHGKFFSTSTKIPEGTGTVGAYFKTTLNITNVCNLISLSLGGLSQGFEYS